MAEVELVDMNNNTEYQNRRERQRRRQLIREATEDATSNDKLERLFIMPELIDIDIPVHSHSSLYCPWQFFRIWNHIFLNLLEEHRELHSTLLSRFTLARFLSLNISEVARVTFCDLRNDFIVVDVQEVIRIPMVGVQRGCIRATATALTDTVDLTLTEKNWEIIVHGDLVQVMEEIVRAKDLLVIWGGEKSEGRQGTKVLVLNGNFGPAATILHFQEVRRAGSAKIVTTGQYINIPAAPMLPFTNDGVDMTFSTSYIGQNTCCLQIVPTRWYAAPVPKNLPGGFFPGSQASTSQSFSNDTRGIVNADVSNIGPSGETRRDQDDEEGSQNESDFSNLNISYPEDETDLSLNDETAITPGRDKDNDMSLNKDLNQESCPKSPTLQQEREIQFNVSKRRPKKRKRQAAGSIRENDIDWTGVEVIPDSAGDSQPEDNLDNHNDISGSIQNRSETSSSSAKIPRVSQENVNPASSSDNDNQYLHEVQHLVSQVLNLSESQPAQNTNVNSCTPSVPRVQEGSNNEELVQLDVSEDEEQQIQEYMRTQVLTLSPSQCGAESENHQQKSVADVLKEQQGQRYLTSQILNLSGQCLESLEEDRDRSEISPAIQNPSPTNQGFLRSREGSQVSLTLSQLIDQELGSPAVYVNPFIKIEQNDSNQPLEIKSLCEIEVDDEFSLYCSIVDRFRSSPESDNVGYLIVEDGTIPSVRVSYIPRPNCLDLEYSDRFTSDISCLIKVYNYSHILSIAEPEADVFLASVKVERTRDGSLELVMNGSTPGTRRATQGQKYYVNAYTQEVPIPRPPTAPLVPNTDDSQNNSNSNVEAPSTVPSPVSRNMAGPSSLQELEEEPVPVVISQRPIATRLRSRSRSRSVQSSHTGRQVPIHKTREADSKKWDECKKRYGIKDNEPVVLLERIEMEDM